MKQYCRYCCYLVTGNGIYCNKRGKTLSEAAAKAANNCHDFAYNPQDAFMENEKGYQTRQPKKKQYDGQIKMEVGGWQF